MNRAAIAIGLSFLLSFVFVPTAFAVVVNVDTATSYAGLNDAYNAAATGETLRLDDGVYDVSTGFTVSKAITIEAANVGQAVLDKGGNTGAVIRLDADVTLRGLRVTGGSIGIFLRNAGDITATLEDLVLHDMTEGIAHDNSGGTNGTINGSFLSFHNINTAITINDGGKVSLSGVVFSNVLTAASVAGSNEGADTISINSYLLDTVTTLLSPANLVAVSNEVAGIADFADAPNHNYARLEGASGLSIVGVRLAALPRKKMVIIGAGTVIDNADTTPQAADGTDFGTIHGSGGVNSFSIKNEGYADNLGLSGGGTLVQLTGTNDDQFTVMLQPTTSTVGPRLETSFQIFYSPTTLGSHSASVSVANDSVDNNPYSFSISGTNQNASPVAVADTKTVNEDNDANILPLGNDTDTDNDPLKVVAATLSSGSGAVSFDDNSVTYSPAANFNGASVIAYTAADAFAQATSNITVTVTAVNDVPVAADDTASVQEDSAVTTNVVANDSDIETTNLSVTAASLSLGQGVISFDASSITYTPTANFNGAANVSYTVSDGSAAANANLVISVQAVNDAPVINADSGIAIEGESQIYDVLQNDTDVDGDSLTISSVSLSSGGGAVAIEANKVKYTALANVLGNVEIAYTAGDTEFGDTSTLSLELRTTNADPVAVNDSVSTLEDTAITIAVLANDTDADDDNLSIIAATLASGQGAIVVSDKIVFTPAANFSGAASINYTVSDGLGSASATVFITVLAVDDAPVAVNDTASTLEDTAVSVSVLNNDSDADSSNLQIDSALLSSGKGVVTISASKDAINYVPATDFHGTAVINYSVTDGNSSVSGQATVTVSAVNDVPVLVTDNETTAEDTPVSTDVLSNDSDVDGDTLTITAASLLSGKGEVNFSDKISFTPLSNFNGAVTISYTVSDGKTEATSVLNINVTAVNDSPIAANDATTIAEDGSATVLVLENDIDVDSGSLSIVLAEIASGASAGQVSLNATKTAINYVPPVNFHGVAIINYTITDGAATSNAQLTITITPVNDRPAAVADTATSNEDQIFEVDVLSNDTDPDSATLSISAVSVVSGPVTASIVNNKIAISPTANSNGNAVVSYVVTDGELTASGQLDVTIVPVNDSPIAVDDLFTINEDSKLTADILDNDIDVDGDPRTIRNLKLISGTGIAEVVSNRLVYIPAANTFGEAKLEYEIFDGQAADQGAVTITIVSVNDPTIINNDVVTIEENESVLFDVLANDFDADGDLVLTALSVLSGSGIATINANKIAFVPAAFTSGVATIEYSVSDGFVTSKGQFEITITPSAVKGSIPIQDIPGVSGIPLLSQALSILPMQLTPDYQEASTDEGGVSTYSITGNVSLTLPAGLNFAATELHGADVLVYSEKNPDGNINSFFVKISLYDFLKRSFASATLPEELIGLIPNVPIVIAYSDLNLDGKTVATLPAPVQTFFSGILNSKFGIPIFNDTGSINLFIGGLGFDLIPATIRKPFQSLGIDAQFIEDNLGVGGRLMLTASVSNVGQVLDFLAYLFPQAQPAGFNLTGIPAVEFAVVLPGVSLPTWLTAGVSQIPVVKALAFQPDAAFQMRYMIGIPDTDFNKGELVGLAFDMGMEGSFRVQMPNLINADSLRDAPGVEALDVRGTMGQNFEANLAGDGVEAVAGMTGQLRLVNEWVNPLGIPGIAIGNAVLFVGGAASVGAKVTNAGAGIDIDIGMGGDISCLSRTGERVGTASMAGFLGLKIGAAVPITGFGISVKQPAMQYITRFRCGLNVQLGTLLGMSDTLVALIPEPNAQEAIRGLNAAATGSIQDLVDQVIEVPLSFAPVGAVLDQFRFQETEFYLATPGIELPGHLSGIGFKMKGGTEFRTSRDSEDWKPIGTVDFSGTIAGGLHGNLTLADYNLADLIVMEDVKAGIDLQIWPPQAGLELSGSQKILGLTAVSHIVMSPEAGIVLDSETSIEGLGVMKVNAASFGRLDQWPPIEPFDMRGSTSLQIDLNTLSSSLHSVVGNITGDAADAYRTALDSLSRELKEEQALGNAIAQREQEIRNSADRINAELRPRFDYVREKLYEAEAAENYFYRSARSYERSHDSRSWWDWGGKAYDWAHAQAYWGLYEVARLALPAARAIVSGAERALNAAIHEVSIRLEPRVTALRISLAAVKVAKQLVFVTVQGLEAANNAAQDVSNALRDSSNLTLHDASATIDSLGKFNLGIAPLKLNLDFELGAVGLRCQRKVDFLLSDPVAGVISAVQSIFSDCAQTQAQSATAVRLSSAQFAKLQAQQFVVATAPAKAVVSVGASVRTAAAPVNDSFSTAVVLDQTVPISVSGTNLDATNDASDSVVGSQSASVWYQWQPSDTGLYQVSATGGDTGLQVHDAALIGQGSAASLLVVDVRAALAGSLIYHFDATKTYLIAVTNQFSEPGAFVLTIDTFSTVNLSAAHNDDFADARSITNLSGTESEHLFGASVEIVESAGDALPIFNSLWWKFTAPETATYSFDSLGSEVDTVLRAYKQPVSVEVNGVVTLADVSNQGLSSLPWLKTSNNFGDDPSSIVNLRLYTGETVWLSLASRYDSIGQVRFNWRHKAGSPSDLINDDFSRAVDLNITEAVQQFNNLGATLEVTEPLHAGVTKDASVWFKVTAPEDGRYVISSHNSSFDTVMALYAGDQLNQLVSIASNDDADSQSAYSRINPLLTANTPYYLALAGKKGGEGDISISIRSPQINDGFARRLELGEAVSLNIDVTDASLEMSEPDYNFILAQDQAPEKLLASFDAALATTGTITGNAADEAAPLPPELLALKTLADDLYQETLANLSNNPFNGSLWWRYTPSQDGDIVIDTLASKTDTALFLFTGSDITNLTALAWSDDADGSLGAQLRYPVKAGQFYVLALVSREVGVASLRTELIALPQQRVSNDHPDNATNVELLLNQSLQLSGNNTYALTTPLSAANLLGVPSKVIEEQNGQRLWWRISSSQSGIITMDTNNSGVDSLIEVYRLSTSNELLLLTLDDDFEVSNSASRARIQLDANVNYYIAVDSINGEVGTLNLNLTFNTSDVLTSNDLFGSAQALSGNTLSLSIDTAFAQYQANELRIGAVARPNSLWYSWTAPGNGKLKLATSGSKIDTLLAIYEGNENDLIELNSNDDADLSTQASLVEQFVMQGNRYYIAIAGKRGIQGVVEFQLDFIPAATTLPVNAQASASTVISLLAVPSNRVVARLSGSLLHAQSTSDTGSDLVAALDATASSRWYEFTAPKTSAYRVSSIGSAIVPFLEVYQGATAANIVLLNSDNGGGGNGQYSEILFHASAESKYFIRITSAYSEQGEFAISISEDSAQPETTRSISGTEGGQTVAAITAAGTFNWRWNAPRDGLVVVSLSKAIKGDQRIEVFAIEGEQRILQAEVALTFPDATTKNANLAVQFSAKAGSQYEFSVTSTKPLLGNAILNFAYQGPAAPALSGTTVSAGVAQVEQILLAQAQNAQSGLIDSTLLQKQVFAALQPLISAVNARQEDLLLEIGQDKIRGGKWLNLTLTDRLQRNVLLSILVESELAAAGAKSSHTQLVIGAAEFQSLGQKADDNTILPLEMKMPLSAFDLSVRQAFISVARRTVASFTDVPTVIAQFQAPQLFDFQLNAFDASSTAIYLNVNSVSAVDGVAVRLPINVSALLSWLAQPDLSNAAAEQKLAKAFDKGILTLVTATDVTQLVAENYTTSSNSKTARVDLNGEYVEFVTPHFSAFALTATADASGIDAVDPVPPTPKPPVIVPQPRSSSGGCSLGAKDGPFDPMFPLLVLLSVLYLARRRNIHAVSVVA